VEPIYIPGRFLTGSRPSKTLISEALYFEVEDHKDYHEPTDDYENIQPKFYVEAVKVIICVFEEIDTLNFN